jgi:hypothetical protein
VTAAVTTRVRGLAPWAPRSATRALLEGVQAVLGEYEKYLPLTIRQIFYRLVGAHDYPKSENAYSNLAEHLNRARRSGIIPFDAIRDDGVTVAEPDFWEDAEQLVDTFIGAARRMRFDRQKDQPSRLIFSVEAAGMLPQVERIAEEFGITVQSSGGFDSTTAKYDLAEKLGQYPRVELLHIGDHDPSGVHLFSSMAEDVQQLAADLGYEAEIKFTRLAVTPKQITSLNLATAIPKKTDNRKFVGNETTQCEAIPPDVLADIVRHAIDSRLDQKAFDAVLEAEKAARTKLLKRLQPLARKPRSST